LELILRKFSPDIFHTKEVFQKRRPTICPDSIFDGLTFRGFLHSLQRMDD